MGKEISINAKKDSDHSQEGIVNHKIEGVINYTIEATTKEGDEKFIPSISTSQQESDAESPEALLHLYVYFLQKCGEHRAGLEKSKIITRDEPQRQEDMVKLTIAMEVANKLGTHYLNETIKKRKKEDNHGKSD